MKSLSVAARLRNARQSTKVACNHITAAFCGEKRGEERRGGERRKESHFLKCSLLLIQLLAEGKRGAEELSKMAWQLFHRSSNKSSDYNSILVGTLTTGWNDYADRNASPKATG